MTPGERIKARREELGYSQEYLSKILGYKDRSTLSKIEKDGSTLPLSKVTQFAKALGVEPAYIMGWQEEAEKMLKHSKTKMKLINLIDEMPDEDMEKVIKFIENFI